MTIKKVREGATLEMVLEGRLDTVTSPDFEKEVNASVEGVDKLILDLAKLEYVSSAGLRVILAAEKVMSKQGRMYIIHASDAIKDLFDMTGFSEILNIE